MPLLLAAGALRLELLPETGGCVGMFWLQHGDEVFDLMRPLGDPPDALPDALYSGMFPMVPFANCIRDNRCMFNGRRYDVAPNMAGVRLNFHGSGWQLPWHVASADGDRAEFVLSDGRVGDVYHYTATQRFRLDPVTLSTGAPWCALTRPTFDLWVGDWEGRAERLTLVPFEASYATPRHPPADYRNVCYAGWDGRADIVWPDEGVTLSLSADPIFGHLMFHVPADGQRVFCLEPQSNAPCGFDGLDEGRIGAGVHILDPGESIVGAMRFSVRTDRC
jgi:aldose 1-epimerase